VGVTWSSGKVGAVAGLTGLAGLGLGYFWGADGRQSSAAAPATSPASSLEVSPDPTPAREGREKRRQSTAVAKSEGPAIALDLSGVAASEWVLQNDAERSWPGYTLVFYERRVPLLIDMNGNIVHSWPEVRAVGRARLTTSGNLVYIASDDAVREVDWNGELVREYATGDPDYYPHHDLVWTPKDEIVAVFREAGVKTDNIVVIDPSGERSWEWRSHDHLQEDFPTDGRKANDLTHFNSVQVLPDNPLHRAGDSRFAAGNVLISARHLDTVYLVDRNTGDVTWKYDENLDWQHEAVMLGDDVPGAGNVMIFNNRYHSADRASEVIEVDPRTNKVVWRYADPNFFSDTAGVGQKLPNGNVLITSSRGGRVFEILPDGEIVWQWSPPYNPMRVQRYAPDFCPQLAALGPMAPAAVAWPGSGPFVDRALYDFAPAKEAVKVKVAGKNRELLVAGKTCNPVHLPGKPFMILGFGFAGGAEAGVDGDATETLRLTLTTEGGKPEPVFEKSVSLKSDGEWTREKLRLDPSWSNKQAELCVTSSAADIARRDRDPKGFVVAAPRIQSGYRKGRKDLPSVKSGQTKKADRSLQQRQLEALGYIE
jgi:outer membrane protein assembly factor BamB